MLDMGEHGVSSVKSSMKQFFYVFSNLFLVIFVHVLCVYNLQCSRDVSWR